MRRVLPSIFCLGAFSLVVQVVLLREMLVVYYGNELCIGVMMASWLLCTAAGAAACRLPLPWRSGREGGGAALAVIPVLLAFLFPVQVVLVRSIHLLMDVGTGEYASLGQVWLGAVAACLPGCFGVGLFFPQACAWRGRRAQAQRVEQVVSGVYALEALGSMLGGAALSYVLLPHMSFGGIVLIGMALALLAGALAMIRRRLRYAAAALAVILAGSALMAPGWLTRAEAGLTALRWRAFGVVSRDAGAVSIYSRDTIYQNLAVIESQGQSALYGDGKIMFVFPDPVGDEHTVHVMMAPHPAARRVLLLGGNPVGMLPELLKYPLERLVYVELDPGMHAAIRETAGATLDRVLRDPRVEHVRDDGPRFAARCEGTFDVVIVEAPEPSTAAANRYCTVEFYNAVNRLLSHDGYLVTSISSSEHLQSDASLAAGSVYETLRRVFPVVLVTAGARNRAFAGRRRILADGTPRLTFDRQVLYERSRGSGIETTYYRPEYLLGADEIDAGKVRLVRERFRAVGAPVSTALRPAAYFMNLRLWSRFSGSGLGRVLALAGRLDTTVVTRVLLAAGGLLVLAGAGIRAFRRGRDGGWSRAMTGVVLASTGCFSMGMEILLVMVLQGLYGYVYARMGLIVAAFMGGLVVGAFSGRIMGRLGARYVWLALLALELLLVVMALGVPRFTTIAHRFTGHATLGPALEAGVYLLVAALGWFTGAEFPLGNRLFVDAGGSLRAASAVTDASDHLGAAIGALAVGVVLVPLLGVRPACLVLAALKGFGALALVSGRLGLCQKPSANSESD